MTEIKPTKIKPILHHYLIIIFQIGKVNVT